MTEPAFTHSRRAQRAIGRIEKAHHLQGSVEAAFYAQRWRPFLQFLLIFGALGDTIFILVARPYWVAATSSKLVMFRAGRVRPRFVGKPVLEAGLDAVRLEPLRGGPLRRRIRIRVLGGPEHQVAVHRAYWKELDRLGQLVDAATA